MTFRYTLSFEHDLHPVETVRGEVEAPDFEDGIRRAVFRAFSARPKNKYRPRSVVVVLEDLVETAPKRPNKSGPPLPPAGTEGPS